jgi:hypothetical protein
MLQKNSGADPEHAYGQHIPQPEPPRLRVLVQNREHETMPQDQHYRRPQYDAGGAAACLIEMFGSAVAMNEFLFEGG